MAALAVFRRRTSGTAVAGVCALWCAGLTAQDAGPLIEEIITTGSRIARDGYSAPTPVSVMSEQEIQANAPGSVSEFVMELPTVSGSTATSNSGALSNGGAGISSLNARGLGAGRTLVLFDGQRSVVSSGDGAIDTNTFPQPLVSRVEVVTGGASSTYGSDAVAGVINFILNRNYTGLKTSADYGQTSQGFNKSNRFTVTAGTPFANGAGHLLLSGEIYDKDGTHYYTPDWNRSGFFGIINPDKSPGQPHYITGHGIGISAYTPGGLITSGPLRGTYFGEGGSVHQLNYGAVSGQWMVGGDWEYSNSGMVGTTSYSADDERDSLFGRVSYELGGVNLFAQASTSRYDGYSFYINPTQTGIRIQADNAFLPQEVRDRLAELGQTSFTMGTSNVDMPASGSNNKRETRRYVVGADGEVDWFGRAWNWDSYYQRGVTDSDEHMTPTFHFDRIALAQDAVFHPETGEIVCRITLSEPDHPCAPLNRFGHNVASQEGLEYVMGRPRRVQDFQQDVVAFNLTTSELLENWAGPVSLAFGAEYREERMGGEVDPEYASGWKYGNYTVTSGRYDVAEAYVETVIPLLARMEFNAAARYTDYSTSGEVNTWKAGIVYTPIDDLMFRVTKSRDIRAPNMGELYAAGTARTNAVNILGESLPFVQNLQGNPNVKPEEADTLGVGVVIQPRFLPGFAMSIDYWDIELNGIIGNLSAQTVANYCFEEGIQRYCDDVNFDDGVLKTIDLRYENLNSQIAKGIDVEASYTFPLGPGDLRLRALVTTNLERISDDGVRVRDSAGEFGETTADWVTRMTVDYNTDAWRFNLAARGISSGVYNNDYLECTSSCPPSSAPNWTIANNHIPSAWYFDANVTHTRMFGNTQAEFFITLRNLFDKEPDLIDNPSGQGAENAIGSVQTNSGVHDIYGRSFRLGLRTEF